jgi:ferredoxin
MTGSFEKPKFFSYRENICAHARSGITGCTQCIDVCSTGAISSLLKENKVVVEPHCAWAAAAARRCVRRAR